MRLNFLIFLCHGFATMFEFRNAFSKVVLSVLIFTSALPCQGFCLASVSPRSQEDLKLYFRTLAQLDLSEGLNRLSLLDLGEHKLDVYTLFQEFISELNKLYGCQLTTETSLDLIAENYFILSEDLQNSLEKVFSTLDCHLKTDEISKGLWNFKFYWPWEWNFFGLNKKKSFCEQACNKSPELILPPHMALGFALTMVGALIFILPFPGAQIIGGEIAFTGAVFFMEGLASGEQIEYVDSVSGERVPASGDMPPSIGVTTGF